MMGKSIFGILFLLTSVTVFGQEKTVRIGPGPQPEKPEPVILIDGIKLPPGVTKNVFDKENEDAIDSVSIQPDSVVDCRGEVVYLGIVKIYTKDSVNLGAKKILALTDEWLYRNPLAKLIINNKRVAWDEATYHTLTQLSPDDIVYAKIKERNDCDTTLKLKIRK